MANVWEIVILTTWIISLAYAVDVTEYNQFVPEWQQKLSFDLTKGYNRAIAPTHEGPIHVELGFTLLYFDFVDEANELATLHGWATQDWIDPRLRWDPVAYNDTQKMVIDLGYIWIPDIESFDSARLTRTTYSKAVVNSTGHVHVVGSYQIDFICQMDFQFFPYDEQRCQLKFGSWHHDSKTINLTAPEYVNLAIYKTAKDFELTEGITTKRNVEIYPCCPDEEYIDITYTISLKRYSGAYGTKLVLPSVLTGFLVLATFLLPTASYERITLCGILFLCLLLLLTYLHDIVPTGGDTIIGEYLAFTLFIDFFATAMAVVSYIVNSRSSTMQKQSDIVMDTEGDDNDLKLHMPKDRKKEWLRYLDAICFVLFSIVFIVGLAIILGRRG